MLIRQTRLIASGLLLIAVIAIGLVVRDSVSGSDPSIDPASSPSGTVTGLTVDAADGSFLMARDGLFRSGDGGQTWTELPVPDDLHPEMLRQVATTTAAPSSVYAAGPEAGIIRSDDSGKSWRLTSDGLPSQNVGAFAVHSFRPDTLYAWIKGQGVFRTEDGGKGWERMDDGPPGEVLAIAHSTLEGSMNTGWLYTATPGGPYLSMDCF